MGLRWKYGTTVGIWDNVVCLVDKDTIVILEVLFSMLFSASQEG